MESLMINKDLFQTPPDLIKVLDKEFNFTLEACADKERRALPHLPYYGLDNGMDAKLHPWGERTFCNPPYSKGNIPDFLEKGFQERASGIQVLLVSADVGTKYWYEASWRASEIRFLKGRVNFWYNNEPAPFSARFSSAIVIFSPSPKPCHTWWWDWKSHE
jgi:phage N-6-adenine-methyltransferase